MLNTCWYDFATMDREKAQAYSELLNNLPPETQEAIENLLRQKFNETRDYYGAND